MVKCFESESMKLQIHCSFDPRVQYYAKVCQSGTHCNNSVNHRNFSLLRTSRVTLQEINGQNSWIVYFLLSSPMTLSIYTRMFAMPQVCSTSTGSSWSLPLVNAGIASSGLWSIRISWIVNCRSAITKSPGSSFFWECHNCLLNT